MKHRFRICVLAIALSVVIAAIFVMPRIPSQPGPPHEKPATPSVQAPDARDARRADFYLAAGRSPEALAQFLRDGVRRNQARLGQHQPDLFWYDHQASGMLFDPVKLALDDYPDVPPGQRESARLAGVQDEKPDILHFYAAPAGWESQFINPIVWPDTATSHLSSRLSNFPRF